MNERHLGHPGGVRSVLRSCIISGIVATLMISYPLHANDRGEDRREWAFRLRVALVVDKPDSNAGTRVGDVVKDGVDGEPPPEGRWVPVAPDLREIGKQGPRPMTRSNARGEVELRVLSLEYDLSEKNIKRLVPTLDRYGDSALQVVFDAKGGDVLFDITRRNVGRRLAVIVNDVVCCAPVIRAVTRTMAIPHNDAMGIPEGTYDNLSGGYFLVVGELILPAWVVFLVLLVGAVFLVSLVPTRGLVIHRCPLAWRVTVAVIGAVILAYWFGVSRSVGPSGSGSGPVSIQITYHISLLWSLGGLCVGGAIGLLGGPVVRVVLFRFAHNLRRLFARLRRVCRPTDFVGPV